MVERRQGVSHWLGLLRVRNRSVKFRISGCERDVTEGVSCRPPLRSSYRSLPFPFRWRTIRQIFGVHPSPSLYPPNNHFGHEFQVDVCPASPYRVVESEAFQQMMMSLVFLSSILDEFLCLVLFHLLFMSSVPNPLYRTMVLIVDSTRLVARIYHFTLCQLILYFCFNFAVDRVPHQDLHLRLFLRIPCLQGRCLSHMIPSGQRTHGSHQVSLSVLARSAHVCLWVEVFQ
jgi:hypothetical protein